MPAPAPRRRNEAELGTKRCILTFATGSPQYRSMAKALAISLHLHGSQADRVILTDRPDDSELVELFHVRLLPPPDFAHWFLKLCALAHTDYDQILFVDGDGLAVRNVDGIFDEFAGSDFAVQGRWLTEPGDWYGDIQSIMTARGLGKIPKFSGGLLYYERTEQSRQLIERILAIAQEYDSLGLLRNGGHVVDEVCIALAMAETGIGKVVADSSFASTTPWRKVGRLELDVVAGRCSFLRRMPETGLELAQPAIYHTAMAKWDLPYWREVRRLLAAYRTPMAPEMSPGLWPRWRRKLRRVAVETYRRLWMPKD